MNINWDAKDYSENFDFVHKYGNDVLELITAQKGKHIVDLGCGNGALSKRLYDMGYDVEGIDASEQMLEIAKEQYPEIKFTLADATKFELENKADCIFSNAVFHWIDDQQALIKNINRQLKINGELVFEFGGKGCAENVHSTLEKLFEKNNLNYLRAFYFPSISEYSAILEENGFEVRYAVLFDRPTLQKGKNGVIDWINMFDKKPFENVSKELGESIKAEAQALLEEKLHKNDGWYIDYVRIRMRAVKKNEI